VFFMEEDVLRLILKAGIQAPSGDNLQEWRISRQEQGFDIGITGGPHFFEPGNFARCISTGALLYNMEVAARRAGYSTKVGLEKVGDDVVSVSFSKDGKSEPSELFKAIWDRATVRTPYRTDFSWPDEFYSAHQDGKEGVLLFRDGEERSALEGAIYGAELIRIGLRPAHDFLSGALRISDKEIARGDGLDYRTLGIPFAPKMTARLLRSWNFMGLVNNTPLQRVYMNASVTRLLDSSEGLGIVTAEDYSKRGFVEAGRNLEKFWLDLTSHGGYLQPFAFFVTMRKRMEMAPESVQADCREDFQRVSEQYDGVLGNVKPALFFRYGVAKPPKVRTLRKPVESFLIK
jgi:hypothetical protein